MKSTLLKTGIAGLLFAASITLIQCSNGSAQGFRTVSVQTADSLRQNDSSVIILDVRTREEYSSETGHLPKAQLIPVQELESRIDELAPYKNKTIITYCRTGRRSETAAAILSKNGYSVLNMQGGIASWNDAHLPVEQLQQPK
ncbi:MAG TPA: rhodanese-like domain-containing protein [Candidatus Kapabacteria bacterium]|nr:rhodanese-like domain-containing protein [Candidatus Kapabacteria bacterium]